MTSRAGRWRPFILSALLHGALVAVLVAGGWWVTSAATPPLQTLAIEATVVDAKDIGALQPSRQPPVAPQPEPEPEPPAEPTPPKPDRTEAQAQREAQTKRIAETKRKAEADAKRKAAAEAEDRRIKAEREAELQRALSAEEDRRNASRLAGLGAQWAQAIQARVQRAWIRPPSAKAGLDCLVIVTQVPGGTVVRAEVRSCNGDEAVKQSIEAAVFRASPLPPPPDPALFERTLELRFRPYD
jgi:colicin import membrane protein